MCDVKLVKLREIDVKKYVFKRALKEAAIKNTTQNLEDCRMDKIQELNNVLIDAEKILIGRVRSRPDRVRRGRLLWTPCKCTKIFIVSNAQKNFQSRNFNFQDVQKRSNVLIDAVRG